MKTTLDLPDELLIEAKKRAAELRRPLRALVEDGLRMVLRKPERSTRKKDVRLITVKGGLPRDLDLSNREAMYEWFEEVIALDTNLLIYAHREGTPEHGRARAAIASALADPRGWGICLPTIAEFWTVTHFFHYLMTEGGGNIWVPGPGFGERLTRWAASLKVRGKRIFDLQIAVIAFEHGAQEIWTHDQNFVSVPSVKIRDPLLTL